MSFLSPEYDEAVVVWQAMVGAVRGNRINMFDSIFVLLVLSFAALATGGLLVNWVGLGRAMSRLSASAYVELHQQTNRTFDPYMPIVVIGATLGGAALAVQYGIHSLSGKLPAAGAVCYA